MTANTPRAVCAALCLLACLVPATTARGEEPSGTAALLAELEAARKDAGRAGLADSVAKVPAAFAGTEDKGERKQLLAALAKVLKDGKAGEARVAAATALGAIDDKAAAWKQLARALPKPKAKAVEPYELEAIRSAGALAQDGAIKPLVQLMQKGKVVEASRAAIDALGGFGASKRRTAVLEALLETTGKLNAAARSAAQNPKGGSGAEPWQALGPSLLAALERLTGQKHDGPDAWLAAAKEHKKDLDKLFRDAGA